MTKRGCASHARDPSEVVSTFRRDQRQALGAPAPHHLQAAPRRRGQPPRAGPQGLHSGPELGRPRPCGRTRRGRGSRRPASRRGWSSFEGYKSNSTGPFLCVRPLCLSMVRCGSFDFFLSITTRFDNRHIRSCLASRRSVAGRGPMAQGESPRNPLAFASVFSPEGAWLTCGELVRSTHRVPSQAPGEITLHKYRHTGTPKQAGMGLSGLSPHGESPRPCVRPPPPRR